MGADSDERTAIGMNDRQTARRKAIEAHGRAWTLLEKPGRSDAETAEMIAAAHESLAEWEVAGGPVEAQRGNWLIARAYADAGMVGPTVEYARRTLDLTETHRQELADFDLAFAEEIAARAWAAADDRSRARQHHARAQALGKAIADEGDRREFFRQFALPPWFGLEPSS
jgi:hypothetical protein